MLLKFLYDLLPNTLFPHFPLSPCYPVGIHYTLSDWNELFTTKCVSCGFPIEAGDRWVEALSNNYHSQCFSCTVSHTVFFILANADNEDQT